MPPIPIKPIVVHVEISVIPSKVEEFLVHAREIYAHVAAEPECIFFDFSASHDEPGLFRIVESWNATREWFDNVQLAKDYYKPYVEATVPMWSKPRIIKYLGHIPELDALEIKPSAIPKEV